MKILRNVIGNQIEIELTSEELRMAYYENIKRCRIENLSSKISKMKIDNIDKSELPEITDIFEYDLIRSGLYSKYYWDIMECTLNTYLKNKKEEEKYIKILLKQLFDNAINNGEDELNFYMLLLSMGINVECVKKYRGEICGEAMEIFCKEHGLI